MSLGSNVDPNFRVQANHPHACFQWQLQKKLKAACARPVETWVHAVRMKETGRAVQAAKDAALQCFAAEVDECKSRTLRENNLEECLTKHAELAIAQLLAAENARQDLYS